MLSHDLNAIDLLDMRWVEYIILIVIVKIIGAIQNQGDKLWNFVHV